MLWAIPFGALFIGVVYGGIFWLIAKSAQHISSLFTIHYSLFTLLLKATGILLLSYLHPLSFDWFKPELMLVHTYLGVQKWQFTIILVAIILTQYRKNSLYLLLVLFAYAPYHTTVSYDNPNASIVLGNTMTTVEKKWDPKLVNDHIKEVMQIINKAISTQKKIVVLPESVFPFFLNNEPKILDVLLQKSHMITIVIGALYLDGATHRNSTYILQEGNYTIANKVRLVPFGESNPLPTWASSWVNHIFFDDAIDYIASAKPTDFKVAGTQYRNAICYEATSELLYQNHPKQMIVTSNNGWFIPSIEPIEQQLLLTFYHRKYGTTIYHSVNMSPSYTIRKPYP
jgi:apolipoprotein N-acyltransferase